MAVPRAIIQEPLSERFDGPSPFVDDPRGLYPVAGETITAEMDSTLRTADYVVHSLRDSMSLMNNEMRNLIVQLSAMEQNSMFLEDSLKSLKLDQNVQDKNENDALRHLSRSLRFFYTGDYRGALQEVEAALELNPNLALAYARRGSIYYKLGDVQRATIDWNLALRLDAEYDDVRNILKALHENRLRTTSVIKE
jgi:tetratricopeptide (TPR) repeat protein